MKEVGEECGTITEFEMCSRLAMKANEINDG